MWMVNVVAFTYQQLWLLWKSRYQDGHGRDIATRFQANAQQVDRELDQFYKHFEEATHVSKV